MMILFIVSSLCRSIQQYPKRLASSLFIFVLDFKSSSETQVRYTGQEGVLRAGFSLLSSKIDNEEIDRKHKAPGRRRAHPPAQPGDHAHSLFLNKVSLWSLAITFAQIFRTGHMQLHVSFAHIITVIVTTVVVIIHANNQLDILEEGTSSAVRQTAFSAIPCWLSTYSKISLVSAALCSTCYLSLAQNQTIQPNQSFSFSPTKQFLLETAVQIAIGKYIQFVMCQHLKQENKQKPPMKLLRQENLLRTQGRSCFPDYIQYALCTLSVPSNGNETALGIVLSAGLQPDLSH